MGTGIVPNRPLPVGGDRQLTHSQVRKFFWCLPRRNRRSRRRGTRHESILSKVHYLSAVKTLYSELSRIYGNQRQLVDREISGPLCE
jgi:hypothetical protein